MHDEISRRAFLRRSAAAAGSIALGSITPAKPEPGAVTAPPKPCPPDAWQKHGIVLEATEPWEGNDVQNFTTCAEPLDGGAWRIWYSAAVASPGSYRIAYAEGVPGKPMKKTAAQYSTGDPADAPFAIGNLPAEWHPVQPTHLVLPDGRHRLYFWAHGKGVCRYLAAESTDGRRYRVLDPLRPVLYHPNDRAAFGVPSPDGVMSHKDKSKDRPDKEPLAEPRLICNDATTVYRLPDGTFEMYSVALCPVPKDDPAYMPHDNAPGQVRVVDRFTSKDGIRFDTRTRVIQRDKDDPADQQFYYLSVTRTAEGCIGMLGHYRCQEQTMDLEWCFSPDGREWQRPLRKAWLLRGAPPAPDCYGIYGPNHLVQRDGRWHLFYTGVNSSHNGKQAHGKPRQVIMYATTPSIRG